jgi:hypothetical protein
MFQGRRITCLPLHAVFECRCDDLSPIECLLEAYPEALLSKEEGGSVTLTHGCHSRGVYRCFEIFSACVTNRCRWQTVREIYLAPRRYVLIQTVIELWPIFLPMLANARQHQGTLASAFTLCTPIRIKTRFHYITDSDHFTSQCESCRTTETKSDKGACPCI